MLLNVTLISNTAEQMSKALIRLSTDVKERLKPIAERDGFTLSQAFDIIVSDALPSLEKGTNRLGASIVSTTKK